MRAEAALWPIGNDKTQKAGVLVKAETLRGGVKPE